MPPRALPYVNALFAGRLDRAGHAALLEQLYVVYETLEQAAEAMRDDPVAGQFVLDDLRRLPGIAADLRFLRGPDGAARIQPSAATRRYQDRLRAVAFTWPAGFVAHHYTRYLGDLSGGQMMARSLRRSYGFDCDGIRFLRFPGLDPRAVKQRYRDLLDAAPWDERERQAFLAEVSRAYQLNTDLLADLGRAVVPGAA